MARKPELEFVFEANINIGEAVNVGVTPRGMRVIFPITGGFFEGPNIKGQVLSGGWDWPLIVPEQYYEVKADYMLQADDGTIIHIINKGKFYASKGEPVSFGFTNPEFEAPLGPHEWLNDGAYLGTLVTEMESGKMTSVSISIYKAV